MVLSEGQKSVKIYVLFIMVNSPSTYNVILMRTTINPHKIIASTIHQKMKLSIPHEIGESRGEHMTSRKCYVNYLQKNNHKESNANKTGILSEN